MAAVDVVSEEVLLPTRPKDDSRQGNGLRERFPERRALIEAAYAAADDAYEIGSRSNDPAAVSEAQATVALRVAYAVARALAQRAALMIRAESTVRCPRSR